MNCRTWATYNHRFGLGIADEAWAMMERACLESRSIETGGVLIGRYVHDQTIAEVYEATLPPGDSTRSTIVFKRGIEGLKRKLAQLWRRAPRLHYLGEWHFHPTGWPHPSSTDIEQMRTISETPNYECPEPILLILSLDPLASLNAQAFVIPRGEPYLPMGRTGI